MSFDQQLPNRLTRRQLLRGALVGGTGLTAAYLLGCSNDSNPGSSSTATAPLPSAVAGTPTLSDVLEWRSLAPTGVLPAARQDHSLVCDGERLLLLGGQDTAPMADLWMYDVASDAWSQLASEGGPAARFGHNAVWHNETSRMIVFGGQGDAGAFFNDVWAYDPASNAWSQLASSGPSPRYGAAHTLDSDGALIVTHGFTDQGRFDDTWRYDIANETWTDISPGGTRPVERGLARASWTRVMDKHLLLFGGESADEPFLEDLWALLGRGWADLARSPGPAARNRHSMVYDEARDKLTLIGGNGADGPLNDVWWFDATNEFWAKPRVVGTPPLHRFGHDAAWVSSSGSVLVFGGTTAAGNRQDELWELATSSEL